MIALNFFFSLLFDIRKAEEIYNELKEKLIDGSINPLQIQIRVTYCNGFRLWLEVGIVLVREKVEEKNENGRGNLWGLICLMNRREKGKKKKSRRGN